MTIVCPVCDKQLDRDGEWREPQETPDRPHYHMCADCLNAGRELYREATRMVNHDR